MCSCSSVEDERRVFITDDINDDLNRYLVICTDKLMIH